MGETFGNRALLAYVILPGRPDTGGITEFADLVASAGLECVQLFSIKRHSSDPHFFIGRGKVEEILRERLAKDADVLIFNQALGPSQEHNLEKHLGIRVIDRIGLILDIFAQRARSYEGKLQVELAQLQHLSTRLVRGWSHLERQKGGIGLRGPGETQLETDRRLVGQRIKNINACLKRVREQRRQRRRRRQKRSIPVVSLVGYTNAGKSSLFNALSGVEVQVADRLFSTLDTTLRQLWLHSGRQVILTDTVGFISDLPHELIDSFHATLEEIRESDLLIHVINIADREQKQARIEQVNKVLKQIGADHIPQLEAYNKVDLLPEGKAPVFAEGAMRTQRVYVSAKTHQGVSSCLSHIDSLLNTVWVALRLCLPFTAGRLRAYLFSFGVVQRERLREDGGWLVDVKMDHALLQQICHDMGFDISDLQYESIHH